MVAFDIADALERVEGDKDLLKELISMFFDQYSQTLAEIKASAEAHDAVRLRDRAHFMKSALGNLSARDAYELAKKIEAFAANGNVAEAALLISDLESAVAKFKVEADTEF